MNGPQIPASLCCLFLLSSADTTSLHAESAEPPSPRAARQMTAAELAALTEEANAVAVQSKLKCVVVPHLAAGPALDGDLDDLYESAARGPLERNSGAQDIAAKYSTEFYLVTDARYLYVACRCREPDLARKNYMEEELHKIDFAAKFQRMSRLTDRDQAMWDDYTWEEAYVEFVLEPGGERKTDDYYHIAVNTLGTLYDASHRDEINWDPATIVKTKHHDGYFAMELAIPLESLVPPKEKFPKLWAANFLRLRHHVGEMAWSKTEKTHTTKSFGTLLFALGVVDN